MAILNEVDVDEIRQKQKQVKNDPSKADREPKIVAHWKGGSTARIELGDIVSEIGSPGNLNSMQTLLAALAACEIDLIAMHAALIGLSIDELWIEASGHFTTESYYGIENAPGSGYDRITYTVHLKASQATRDQILFLKERCERSSPVGDSLSKPIPLTLEIISDEILTI